MPLPTPNLDDRQFADLVEAAKLRIKQRCPEWNDLSPSDPGMVLVEAFAFLTETMIYRLNRTSEKAYIEFLNLIGVKICPPSAAQASLQFTLAKALDHNVEIPKNTRIAAQGESSVLFTLSNTTVIPAGNTSVLGEAYHCYQVEGELIGKGVGLPGLAVTVKHQPIIAPTADQMSLIIGIEALPDELEPHNPALQFNGKSFRIWREVDNFSQIENSPFAYVTDRHSGTIYFAPALNKLDPLSGQSGRIALAEIPPEGREIRAWYRYGGGSEGNVLAGVLSVLKDPIPGVAVNNPEPAFGGHAAETLQNALIRGPQELHSLSRAVTARDFELIATQSSGAINRAKAFTQAKLWQHATPGTVEVTLVPELDIQAGNLNAITAEKLKTYQTPQVLEQIHAALNERRPLGTHCVVNWANFKKITIKARIYIQREEDAKQVKKRVLENLYLNICPLKISYANRTSWPFGQSLKAWDVYKIIGSEPAVISVESMEMLVDDVPDTGQKEIASDAFQSDTWYTGSNEKLLRSSNNGQSWELIAQFSQQKIKYIVPFPSEACNRIPHPGLVAIITQTSEHASSIQVSFDCGNTWRMAHQFQFMVDDLVWLDRDGQAYLLVATEKGLYEISLDVNVPPLPILVDPKMPDTGFRAITVSATPSGRTFVAVASYENKGVYLSWEGGKSKSFQNIGLVGELIEVLTVQHKGSHRYIWAGIGAPGNEPGKGCYRWTLSDSSSNLEGWIAYSNSWAAGSCRNLTFLDEMVFAASYRFGVLRLNSDITSAAWETLNPSCGLPLKDVNKLETVDAVAANKGAKVIMAATAPGIYRSEDSGLLYLNCSQQLFKDEIKIPPDWLIYSGEHQIDILNENEISGH